MPKDTQQGNAKVRTQMQVSSPKTLYFTYFMVLARVSLLCAVTLNGSTTGN